MRDKVKAEVAVALLQGAIKPNSPLASALIAKHKTILATMSNLSSDLPQELLNYCATASVALMELVTSREIQEKI